METIELANFLSSHNNKVELLANIIYIASLNNYIGSSLNRPFNKTNIITTQLYISLWFFPSNLTAQRKGGKIHAKN
jgi:hypothetical protein